MNKVRQTIESFFLQAMETAGHSIELPIDDNQPLLGSGVDSLGFAILVTQLENELGYDPFVQMKEPTYPTTFGEFVSIYENCPSNKDL